MLKELEKLDAECRGFLLFLEQAGVPDSQNRESVLIVKMVLESEDVVMDNLNANMHASILSHFKSGIS